MKCVGCLESIKKGEFVVMNGGAMVGTKTMARMGDKNLLGFLNINNHFDSKKNYKSLNLSSDASYGQFEFYACSHKCLADFMTRQIMLLKKRDKIKKFEMAPSNKVKKLELWVKQVLKIIGHPDALVTDMSTIWDFIDTDENEKFLPKWSKKLGFKISGDDYIWEIARLCMDRKKKKSLV